MQGSLHMFFDHPINYRTAQTGIGKTNHPLLGAAFPGQCFAWLSGAEQMSVEVDQAGEKELSGQIMDLVTFRDWEGGVLNRGDGLAVYEDCLVKTEFVGIGTVEDGGVG